MMRASHLAPREVIRNKAVNRPGASAQMLNTC
jgi:hypothetical protein